MNPDPQQPANPLNPQPSPVPDTSTPESDQAALAAIEALEAESAQSTPQPLNDVPPFQDSLEALPADDSAAVEPVTYGQTLNPAVSPVDVQGATVGIPTEAAVVDPAIDDQEIEPAPLVAPAPNSPSQTTEPQNQSESKKPGNAFIKVLLVVLGLAILGAAGFFGWQFFQSTQSSDSTIQNSAPSETVPMGSMPEDEQASPSSAP